MRNLKKSILVVVIALFVLGVLTACSLANDNPGDMNKPSTGQKFNSLEELKERDTIRIGVFGDKPPFGFIDENGEHQGFDIYIARRFAKDLLGDESKAEFVLVDPASRVAYLETNKVDIIMANFTVTEERREKVDFANPYMRVSLGVVSPESRLITSVEQLRDEKVIVAKGTTAENYFIKHHPDIELLKFEQYTEIFEALKDGRGAAIANDNTEVIAWARENPGFSVGITSLGGDDTIAPAVAKGNTELLNWINEELIALGKENFIHEAYDATLSHIYGDEYRDELVIEGGEVDK